MKKSWLALPIILGVLLLVAIGCREGDTIVSRDSLQSGLSVNGEGKVTAAPDLATTNLGIEAQEPTVAQARTEAAAAMDKMITSLKANGIEEKDIKTSNFSIYPVMQWDQDKQQETLLGYRVTNMVTVKIRALEKIGQIVDATVTAGGDFTRVQGISFSIEDPKPYQSQAREAAFTDAKTKAQQMANAAGVQLGKIISISESSAAPPPIRFAFSEKAAGAALDTTTPISPGELDITTDVQILYEIK